MGILDEFSQRTASEWKRKIKELTDAAEEQGWTVNITKKNQYQFIPADPDQNMVMAAGTASDHRAFDNVIARLKRSGFLWPWDKKAKEQFNQQETAVAPEEKKQEFEHRDYAAEQQEEADYEQAKFEIQYINQLIRERKSPKEIEKELRNVQAKYKGK
jgi:hypothetical protein